MKLKMLLLMAVMSGAVCSVSCGAGPSRITDMTGGWSPVATDDPGVKTAAEYAVSVQAAATGEKLKLVAVQEAHRQVVAGMNYRLKLALDQNGNRTTAEAVIWAKLDGSYELTKWSWTK